MIRLRPLLWRAQLHADARRAGGAVVLHRRAQLHQRTIFQGRGSVAIEAGVILGWPEAGAPRLPILLQPREAEARILIGEGSILTNGCELIARNRIEIGKHCRIGVRTTILDSDFHECDPQRRDQPGTAAPVVIEDNVWLGLEVLVLKGVRIGRDAVIGARTIVTRDVPPGAIIVGPAGTQKGSVYPP